MRRSPIRAAAAWAVAFALLAVSAAWAGDEPTRPDKVADDPPPYRVLTLDRKGGPPGPVEIPKPIKPIVGDASPGKGGLNTLGSGFGVGVPIAAGASATARTESRLKVLAEKLR